MSCESLLFLCQATDQSWHTSLATAFQLLENYSQNNVQMKREEPFNGRIESQTVIRDDRGRSRPAKLHMATVTLN